MKAVKRMRKNGILNNKLKDFTFDLNYKDYTDFINDFVSGKVGLDPELYLAESLSTELHRPMIFISSLDRHKQKPIFSFNVATSHTPPLVYGIYMRENQEIFLPFFLNKHLEFKNDSLKGKVQVIAYVSKTVPEAFKSRPIIDLEIFALLTALYTLQRFISGVKVNVICQPVAEPVQNFQFCVSLHFLAETSPKSQPGPNVIKFFTDVIYGFS